MSLPRYAKRRDETESDIVNDLRKCGYLVERRDFPDLNLRKLFWKPGMAVLLEVEGLTKNRKRSPEQLKFLRDWNIPIVKTTEDALKALGAFT